MPVIAIPASMNLTSTICLHQWPSLISGSPNEVSRARNWTASLFLRKEIVDFRRFQQVAVCSMFTFVWWSLISLPSSSSKHSCRLMAVFQFWTTSHWISEKKSLGWCRFCCPWIEWTYFLGFSQLLFLVCGCRCVDFTPAGSAESLLTELEIAATAAVFLELSQHTGCLDPCLPLRMWQSIQTKAVKPASTCG